MTAIRWCAWLWSYAELRFLLVVLLGCIIDVHFAARNESGAGYLQFEACHGFANQRLSIVYGAVAARELQLQLVLPPLPLNGIEGAKALKVPISTEFGSLYDEEFFRSRLEELGVQVANIDWSPPLTQVHECSTLKTWDQCRRKFLAFRSVKPHLKFGCPFLTTIWDKDFIGSLEEPVLLVLKALRPSVRLLAAFKELKQTLRIQDLAKVNVLHFRAETDWKEHCTKWEAAGHGTNCMGYLSDIGSILQERGLVPNSEVYIAADWEAMDVDELAVLEILKSKYHVIHRPHLWKEGILQREEFACIEYYLSLQSGKFIGNSVSTFTALQILERRFRGLWASYYNGGDIPLQHILPLYKLPWVFVVVGTEYDYMIRPAVRSALRTGKLKPYAIALPRDKHSTTLEWLRSVGVQCLIHSPTWIADLLKLKRRTNKLLRQKTHLHRKIALLGTFLRLDIPIISEVLQFENILYTDTDVYFRPTAPLGAIRSLVSKTIRMDYELKEHFPMNAGVYIANVQFLRQTHQKVINQLRMAESLDFGRYGPVDQGLLNLVYERELRKGPTLPLNIMNGKPYKPYNPESWLVHFHGPKPKDYLDFLENGTCRFQGLCSLGVQNAACQYITEWLNFSSNQHLHESIPRLCDRSVSV